MPLELTADEYSLLLKYLCRASFVVRESEEEEFDGLAGHVAAQARAFNAQELVNTASTFSSGLQENASSAFDEYDETVFWEHLSDALAERDLDEEGLDDPDQFLKRKEEYLNEFSEKGIDRLRLKLD